MYSQKVSGFQLVWNRPFSLLTLCFFVCSNGYISFSTLMYSQKKKPLGICSVLTQPVNLLSLFGPGAVLLTLLHLLAWLMWLFDNFSSKAQQQLLKIFSLLFGKSLVPSSLWLRCSLRSRPAFLNFHKMPPLFCFVKTLYTNAPVYIMDRS